MCAESSAEKEGPAQASPNSSTTNSGRAELRSSSIRSACERSKAGADAPGRPMPNSGAEEPVRARLRARGGKSM